MVTSIVGELAIGILGSLFVTTASFELATRFGEWFGADALYCPWSDGCGKDQFGALLPLWIVTVLAAGIFMLRSTSAWRHAARLVAISSLFWTLVAGALIALSVASTERGDVVWHAPFIAVSMLFLLLAMNGWRWVWSR